MFTQVLTFELGGEITAGDYLACCRDADYPLDDSSLASVTVAGDPLGSILTAVLRWHDQPPGAHAAAAAAGFELTRDVLRVRSSVGVPRRAPEQSALAA